MLVGRKTLLSAAFVVGAILIVFVYLFADLRSGSSDRGSLHFVKSSFDWGTVTQHHPIASLVPLPTRAPKTLPPVQFDFGPATPENSTTATRRNAVRDAFVRCWTSYKEHAWLHDELAPVSGGSRDPYGGWGATLIDSLDTLWIMGLEDEFHEAAEAAVKVNWNHTAEWGINVFETTIRYLGGLLSAHDLSGEPALLWKAQELGDMLYMAFDTPNRMPDSILNFEHAQDGTQVAGLNDASAGPTSLSLEFTRLAQLTGQAKYYDAIDRVRAFLARTQNQTLIPGLWPLKIDLQTESVVSDDTFSFGAQADSLYEYLLKMYILLSGRDDASVSSYETMYRVAMDAAVEHLVYRPMLPDKNDILFVGLSTADNESIRLDPQAQHLACFSGGMFALGSKVLGIDDHLGIGERVTRGCGWAYQVFSTGVMPESLGLLECRSAAFQACDWDEARWENEGDQRQARGIRNLPDPRYLLRPEAIESLFILYRITGKEDLRETAWWMFQSVMNATLTAYANSAIKDVTATGPTEKLDSMESFWLAETLKYFYLIFSPPNLISLDQYVLNTEAHPLKRGG
ncbi:glycoside hydrolase family 47 protein [Thozetella sp. PMI_491]|nr:glycoside hydrolase family 47 protein [Thozetella sp. PMI_491]